MKYLKIFIPIATLLFITSCRKGETIYEYSTTTSATWYNQSGVTIRFVPYYKGHIVSEKVVNIADKDSLFLGYGNFPGKLDGSVPMFSSDYVDVADSLHIIYDEKYLMAHMVNFPDSLLQSFHLPFKHKRNIGNPENYKYWLDKENSTMYHSILYYEFTFTPEDYEYAKINGLKVD